MSTIVKFRSRRDEADAARHCGCAACPAPSRSAGPALPGAEIILMPIAVLAKGGAERPRKALSRRFGMRKLAQG